MVYVVLIFSWIMMFVVSCLYVVVLSKVVVFCFRSMVVCVLKRMYLKSNPRHFNKDGSSFMLVDGPFQSFYLPEQ